jgi:ribosomal protein S18 acetylase RimI-like enzyme
VHTIRSLSAADVEELLPDLVELLRDSVESGASVGFILPFSPTANKAYWQETMNDIENGDRILLVAEKNQAIVGSVQLELATRPNALHRAEVQKLLVHSLHRKQGIGQALMSALEEVAHGLGRTLLVLDTLLGDNGERLYDRCGYTRAGEVPNYARLSDGSLHATVIFYKCLDR